MYFVVQERLITFGANSVTRYLLWKHEKRLYSDGGGGGGGGGGTAGEASNDRFAVRKRLPMKRFVPVTIGIGLLGYFVSRKLLPEYGKTGAEAKEWQVKIYSLLPLRFFSRVWGTVTNIDLPVFLRPKIYSFYANSFGVNMEECVIQDLTRYRNLSEFFIRPIKEEYRPIDHDCKCVVSPADGKILSFGKITSCQVEQVKGVTYSLQQFLGRQTWRDPNNNAKKRKRHIARTVSESSRYASSTGAKETKEEEEDEDDDGGENETDDSGGGGDVTTGNDDSGGAFALQLTRSPGGRDLETINQTRNDVYIKRLKEKEETDLYQCVVYLAPGDYHRFHSPVSWKVNFRRHFQGKLLSVNPAIARWIGNLFSLNERAVYIGSWFHGFFSLTAVGATNVGSIKVQFDPSLRTNQWKNTPNVRDCFFGKTAESDAGEGRKESRESVAVSKGELFGEFRLGSTIVLIFEAPKNFRFDLEPGQKVKYGQKIGVCC